MPRVPQTDNVVPIQPDVKVPDPVYFAMAAATMHAQGRLFPQPKAEDDSRK
jgi:hypothetical protein